MPRRSRDGGEESQPVLKRGRYSFRMTRSRTRRLARLGNEIEGRVNKISDEDFKKKFTILEVEEKPGASLKVMSVDNHLTLNRREHHTKEYDQQDLIVRRGQAFKLTITFDREIDQAHDTVLLQVTFGDQPKESKGTMARIPVLWTKNVSSSDMADNWSVSTVDQTGKTVTLNVTCSSYVCIGRYSLFVESNLKDQDMVKRYKHQDEFIVLFNPWCEDDSVYMKTPEWRKEYVLNESGKVWVGSQYRNHGRSWNFGQFSEPCLNAALYLLDKADLADSGRFSPVSIVRIISSMANSMDEPTGVLEGRWTSEYPDDCTLPWVWTGSVDILKEFMQTDKPVQYGQCWVFSCLVTTLLRSLGIPTRTVTNFESAHDTDCSMTIDYHYDEDGEPDEDLNDSKWNFHVWNESWFKRQDLPPGYDGWQAHDGTPQELSEGVMRCGPASLKAIKEGHVYLSFDTNFIFSEVNGDKVNWRVFKDGRMEVLSINEFAVGRNISTKAVGSDLREDLTGQYKYPEGSEEERKIVKFVQQFGTKKKEKIYKTIAVKEIELEAVLPNDTMVGDDAEIKVKISNMTHQDLVLDVRITVANCYYTGIAGRKVKTEKMQCSVPADNVQTVSMWMSKADYVKQMNPEGRFKVNIHAKNVANDRLYVVDDVFVMAIPDKLSVHLPPVSPYLVDTVGKVEFKNITQLTLTNGMFSCDAGNGLIMNGFKVPVKRPIAPGETVVEEFVIHPTRRYSRKRRLYVTFNCTQFVDVEGYALTKIVNTPPKDADETDSSDDED
ncbi:protein-glutamine gamma-glutamyltransferase K-like [Argopecten irradians]|uniref:protein-glutamine gamma-glutamyltransferase K-like n=1 Tax=Argopecten irradians TaxID=31199 RepID=UPI0037237BA9